MDSATVLKQSIKEDRKFVESRFEIPDNELYDVASYFDELLQLEGENEGETCSFRYWRLHSIEFKDILVRGSTSLSSYKRRRVSHFKNDKRKEEDTLLVFTVKGKKPDAPEKLQKYDSESRLIVETTPDFVLEEAGLIGAPTDEMNVYLPLKYIEPSGPIGSLIHVGTKVIEEQEAQRKSIQNKDMLLQTNDEKNRIELFQYLVKPGKNTYPTPSTPNKTVKIAHSVTNKLTGSFWFVLAGAVKISKGILNFRSNMTPLIPKAPTDDKRRVTDHSYTPARSPIQNIKRGSILIKNYVVNIMPQAYTIFLLMSLPILYASFFTEQNLIFLMIPWFIISTMWTLGIIDTNQNHK